MIINFYRPIVCIESFKSAKSYEAPGVTGDTRYTRRRYYSSRCAAAEGSWGAGELGSKVTWE